MTVDTTERHATAGMTTILVAIGATLVLAAGAAHGDLPERSGEAALRFVASHDAYALVHVVSILGGVLWAVGLRGYPQLLDDPRARVVASWASGSALVGAGVLAVQFSLDGFGLPVMADRFTGADPATQAMLGEVTEIGADALVGLALLWVIVLYGVTICLLAAADLLEPSRARWIAVAGSAVGAWIAGAALSVALGGTVVPDWLAFVSAIVGGDIWLIAWAASLRRRVNGMMRAGPYGDDRRAV